MLLDDVAAAAAAVSLGREREGMFRGICTADEVTKVASASSCSGRRLVGVMDVEALEPLLFK